MKRAKRFTIRRIALGLAVAAIAPATAQASPIDMTGEDFRYLHAQAVADAKKRVGCRPTCGRPWPSSGLGVSECTPAGSSPASHTRQMAARPLPRLSRVVEASPPTGSRTTLMLAA